MPPQRPPRTPVPSFFIVITPIRGGFDVVTDPPHLPIQEVVELTVRGRVAIRTDATTRIVASADRPGSPSCDQIIAPRPVRNGLLQLASIGAEELNQANLVVAGYLYDTVVAAIMGSLEERGIDITEEPLPIVTINDGPIPQLRTATRSWWRDVGHVVVSRKGGHVIRLRGIPANEPFAGWGNERILAIFTHRLARALGVSPDAIAARARLRAV